MKAERGFSSARITHEGPRPDTDPYKDRVEIKTPEKKELNRREVLTKAIGTTAYLGIPTLAGAGAVELAWKKNTYEVDQPHLPEKTPEEHLAPEQELAEMEKKTERVFYAGALAGSTMHNLAAKYFDFQDYLLNEKGEKISTRIPESFVVHPEIALTKLWDQKEIADANFNITNLGNKHIEGYRQDLLDGKEEQTNIIDFMKDCEKTIQKVTHEQDDEKVKILYGLDDESMHLFKELRHRIHSQMLIGFSMTEIMSSGINTETDMLAYDAVLRTNGARFVTRVPALYDKVISSGPYQATLLAMNIGLALTAEGKPHLEYTGASRMNRALPNSSSAKIPEEFQNALYFHKFVNPEHHHSFATQFALHNIAVTLGSIHLLDPKLRAELSRISDDTLTSFIATSHHKPTPSSAALIMHLQTGRAHDFRAFCDPELQKYATKTLVNKAAITDIHAL